ncbi:MAG: SIR2 family protein [Deltaproteobacteria bacterium]|nr:SIR2 family protein [Deltaproteobacteria bacterium]
MKKDTFDDIGKMPLEGLIDAGQLEIGQKVVFRYMTEAGKKEIFEGSLQKNGITVDGHLYSISYSAVYCMKKAGDQRAINGWLAWQTEDGRYLAEVYQQFRDKKPPSIHSKSYSEKYYQYPSRRDVVFIFGAGASYADGAPLQEDILPRILETNNKELCDSLIHRVIKEFLADNFKWNKDAGYYPTLEEVFGFIDYFIQKGESLNQKYSLGLIIEIKEALIKLTHYIISFTTSSTSRVYQLFWEAIYKYNKNISTIVLNYDTYLEDAFSHMFPRNIYLDYCLRLANYDYSEDIDDKNWWVNPREPILSLSTAEPVSIKIIKIHGSLNWKYCNCCNQVLLTPLDKKFDMGIGDTTGKSQTEDDIHSGLVGLRCSRDGNEFQTLLVPPSHMKNLSHPVNSQLFIESSEEIRRAKKVVFIGYSLRPIDVHVKAILKKSLKPDTEIMVVDTNTSEEFRFRYQGLSFTMKPY